PRRPAPWRWRGRSPCWRQSPAPSCRAVADPSCRFLARTSHTVAGACSALGTTMPFAIIPRQCEKSGLAPLEHRLALLDEGAARLLRVLGLRQEYRDALFEAIAVARRHIHRRVHRLLGVAHADRAFRRDLLRQLHR